MNATLKKLLNCSKNVFLFLLLIPGPGFGQYDSYTDTLAEIKRKKTHYEYSYYDSGELLSIERGRWRSDIPIKSYFYKNGYLKTDVFIGATYHYSESVKDQIVQRLIGNPDYPGAPTYDYRDGELYQITSLKRVNKGMTKIPYMISKGQFIKQRLYDGTINFYSEDDQFLVSKKVKNGKQQEGLIYQGEICNLTDSTGKRQGKWVDLGLKSYEEDLSSGDLKNKFIQKIEFYEDGIPVDTTFRFYKSGNLHSIHIHQKDSIAPYSILYREDGTLKQKITYSKDQNGLFSILTTHYYSDSIQDCIVKKTIERKGQAFPNFTYAFKDCQLYSKTSTRREIYHNDETTEIEEIIDGRTYTRTVEIGFDTRPIPYTAEIGTFDDEGVNLVNGKICYYSARGELLHCKEVINGLIIE
ncbi:MAG: hypothetical protein MI810_07430 [Flavobacteriales bacterium]|nr:hypothetical protein [Flavobacteriales bacterium]